MYYDLTKGKISKNLILFAIPLLLSSLVQQLYNTVDLIFVGNFNFFEIMQFYVLTFWFGQGIIKK